MNRYGHGLLKGILALAVAVTLAVSVHAQYQTPTSPRGTTGMGSSRTQRTLGSLRGNRQGQQDETGKPPSLSERLRGLREKREKGAAQGEGAAQKGAAQPKEKAEKTPPGARAAKPAGAGPTVIAPGAAGAGAAGAGAGAGIRTSGAAAKPGLPAAPGAGGVRIVGPPTYDPLLQRDLKYEPVPEIPNPPEMTLNGPMAVGDFLETLQQATEWNVVVTEPARATMLNFWIAGVTPGQALQVLQFHDIWYEYNSETKYLTVMTKQEYLEKKFGEPKEHEFIVQHANVDYIESALQSLMSPIGRMMVDPRTNHLFIWDRQENLDRMQVAMDELDVTLPEEQFQVTHANIADIEAIINSYISPGGSMITDPRTGRIVVKDLQDNLNQMRVATERFDIPLEPRVYQVKYMNADALVESIQALLTPDRGMLQMDPRTNTIIITDLPARQQRIGEIIATLDQPLETRTWVLQYIEPDAVSERIENLVPEEMGNIVVDEDVHQLTVTATADRIKEIDQMVQMWDVKRQQVLIEAYLVTLGSNLARSLNINWSFFSTVNGVPVAYRVGAGATPDYTNLADTITLGQVPIAEPLRNRFSGTPLLNLNGKETIDRFGGNKIAATLNYLDTNGQVSILSAPRVTVQDGAEAMFQSGRNVPYITSTTYDYGSTRTTPSQTQPNQNINYGYRPYNRIEFIEVGTILTVMPRISEDKSILLEISAEDSDATPTRVVANGEENTIPEKTVSLAETQVRVRDGQTIVIGGLRRGNSTESLSRSVPLLSDVPIIGRLFRSPVKNIKNDTLMIFLTTTIVSEGTHPEAEKLAAAEEAFSEKLRKAEKGQLGRLWESVTHGENEIGVSIGQSGDMHSAGHRVTLDDLRRIFFGMKNPLACRVVIRAHPRAPESVVTEVTELALEVGLKVEFDDRVAPFVPDYPPAGAPPERLPNAVTPLPETPPGKLKIPARADEPLVIKP
ncbi:MAG: hypothetical protein NTZ09_09585 [Candidatus Hydrogenedentes bacterium]|nr:hypothetical protein [Candidatus Hydrogenedentota bacterium]